MDRSPQPLSPISLSGNPNPLPPALWPLAPEWTFDSSEELIPTPIATHLSPIPKYSWEDTDSMSTVVLETPEVEGLSWMDTDSMSTLVPETAVTEASSWMESDCMSTVVLETPQIKRARKRPVEEEEWFKVVLVILLPGMADLL